MRPHLPILLLLAACGGAGAEGPRAGAPDAGAPPPSAPAPGPAPTAAPTPPAASSASPSCWPATFPSGQTIRAVAPAGAGGLWAVGLPGVVLRRAADGGWSASCLAAPVALAAVWATTDRDAWAAGEQSVFRWDGAAWTRVALPLTVNGAFASIWASSPDDVWLVAEDVAVHWDGRGFTGHTLATVRSLGFPFGAFREVWGTAPGDVWIAADRGTLHWDGTAWWGSLAAPEDELLHSVWSGAGVAWTAGVSVDGGGAAWRWDGTRWRQEQWQGGMPLFDGVRGADTGEVFFTTATDLVVRRGAETRALGAPAVPAGDPLVVGAADVWLPDARGVVHWNGSAWTRVLDVPR
jgi:hypothetical protein